MSEREKQILETIATAIPKMSDFDKGYLLGMGEAMVSQKQDDRKKKEGDEARLRYSRPVRRRLPQAGHLRAPHARAHAYRRL